MYKKIVPLCKVIPVYKKILFALSLLLFTACTGLAQNQSTGLGIAVSENQLRNFDLIVSPDGGLPAGSGTATQGKMIFEQRCQACHGASGEGGAANITLVGGNMQSSENPLRTVGSFWPYASTLFDYIRRAMPADSPKSLSNTEVYQVTAYVLYLNGIVEQDTILNRETLNHIEMPNKDGFIDRSQRQ